MMAAAVVAAAAATQQPLLLLQPAYAPLFRALPHAQQLHVCKEYIKFITGCVECASCAGAFACEFMYGAAAAAAFTLNKYFITLIVFLP